MKPLHLEEETLIGIYISIAIIDARHFEKKLPVLAFPLAPSLW
jgi:hypothetical protein